jgi:predicted nucleic acid-binding protein
VTIYEISRKLAREKGTPYAQQVVNYMKNGFVVNLDADMAQFAAQVGQQYGLAMADSIIYATTLQYGATLWTTDAHFENLQNVQYFSKRKI